jgi:serralysin
MKSLPEMQPGIKLASRVQKAQCSLRTIPPFERVQIIITENRLQKQVDLCLRIKPGIAVTFNISAPFISLTNKSGDNNIDGLLSGSAWTKVSAKNPIVFGFPSTIDHYEESYDYRNQYKKTFQAFSGDQQLIATTWLQLNFGKVANLFFKRAQGRNATIRLAMSDYNPSSSKTNLAHAYFPSSGAFSAGDAWFNRKDYNDPAIGTKAYFDFGHELAHSLGLKHGHEKGGIADVAVSQDRDSMEFTILTYRSYVSGPEKYQNEKGGFAQSLMMYDIAALQYMYGAKFSSVNNDSTYQFSETTGEMFINGISQGVPVTNRIFRTIWDDGGYDRYEFDNYKTNLSIDLSPGGWMDLDVGGNSQRARLGKNEYARAHIFNALEYNGDSRSLIEDVLGGTGSDYIKGNRVRNFISGGNGNDTIHGKNGDDFLLGGNGKDILHGDDGDDQIDGDAGNDVLHGGNGHDIIFGGDGFDIMHGGNGSDRFYGGRGVDKINAGGGVNYDNFHLTHRGRLHYDDITGISISGGYVNATFFLEDSLDNGLRGEVAFGLVGLVFDDDFYQLKEGNIFLGPNKTGDSVGSPSGIYVNTNNGMIYYNDSTLSGSHLLAIVDPEVAQSLRPWNFHGEFYG